MANVCLIYPRDINLNFFPLGLGYVASYIKSQGHNVTFLDIKDNDFDLLDHPKVQEADIIGVSITTPQLRFAQKIFKKLKNDRPDLPIVAGGIHPSYFKQKFLEENNIDYIVYGEGEITMNELCNAIDSKKTDMSDIRGLIYRNGDQISINLPRELIPDLDEMPFPARELVNYDTYLQPPGLIRGVWTERSANLSTSRGCPGRCTYCGVNYLYNKMYRRRTVDSVISEIEFMIKEHNIDSLYFMDDTFLMNTEWIEEFSDKFIAKKFNIKFSCYGRVETVNEKILRAVKRAGCVQVEYGVESGSVPVLKAIKKNVDINKIKDALRLTKKIGLRAQASFIFGFPDDKIENLMDTINLVADLDIDFSTAYFATPYPASELYEQAIKEDRIIENDMSKWYVRANKIWRVNLDHHTLEVYRNKFLKQVRWNNIMFFFKNPKFLFNLSIFALKNIDAVYGAIKDSIKYKSFDDAGYYFYAHLTKGQETRNLIR